MSVLSAITDLFSPNGLLFQPPLNDIFTYRKEQSSYAEAIATSLESNGDKKFSIYNASGGMGKTIGYLLPAVLYSLVHKETVAIATSTIALRDDILEKEQDKINRVIRVINADLAFRAKHDLPELDLPKIGTRRSQRQYISDNWLNNAVQKNLYPELTRYFDENNRDIDAYFADHTSLPKGLSLSDISMTKKDNGPSRQLFSQQSTATSFNVVLITQAFLMMDSLSMRKKDGKIVSYLSEVNTVIVDEAEHLGDAASMLEYRVTTSELKELTDSHTVRLAIDTLETHFNDVMSKLPQNGTEKIYTVWQDLDVDEDGNSVVPNRDYDSTIIDPILDNLKTIASGFSEMDQNTHNDVGNALDDFRLVIDNTRAIDVRTTMFVRKIVRKDSVDYELRKVYYVQHEPLKRIYWKGKKMILTSAFIIAPGSNLKNSIKQFGLYEESHVAHCRSFGVRNYGKAALVVNGWRYSMYDKLKDGEEDITRTSDTHITMCAEVGSYAASQGRAVMLCNSYSDADRITEKMVNNGTSVIKVERGVKAARYRDKFINDDNFILVMTAWEGVDLPNIDHLIVTKIPMSPLDTDRMTAVGKVGKRAPSYNTQNAARKLAQGFARAIRDASNAAVFWVMDQRFLGRTECFSEQYNGQSPANSLKESFIPCFPDRFSDEVDRENVFHCLPDEGVVKFVDGYGDDVRDLKDALVKKDKSFEKCFS